MRVDLSNVPTFQKIFLLVAAIAFIALSSGSLYQQQSIYRNAPPTPRLSTGQIQEVQVMHGSKRYLTAGEYQAFLTASRRAEWAGFPVLIVLGILLLNANR